MRIQALVGNLLPEASAALLVCAYVAILGRELTLQEPCTILGTEAGFLVKRFDDENKASGANLLNHLLRMKK